MYYFKCSNCGCLNKITSEYLVFCSKCGKKLQITFRDWHLKNPDKNLNDFLELFCINENELKNKTKKAEKKNYKKHVSLVLYFIIISLVFIIESVKISSFFINETEIKDIKSEIWTRKEIGNISVETPFLLVNAASNIQNEIISDFKSSAYTSEDGFEMLITSIKYTNNIAEQNLIGTSSDPVNQMQSNSSISNIKYKKYTNNKKNIDGILYKGSYLRKNEDFEFIIVTYAQNSNLWQLIIVYKPEYKWEKYKSYRIFNSLEINE